MTTTTFIPARFGDRSVMIEAVVLPGTGTSGGFGDVLRDAPGSGSSARPGRVTAAADRVLDAFEAAGDAIVDLSDTVARSVAQMAERGASPDQVEVEFGLTFTTTGSIIVATGTAEASLTVRLTYHRDRPLLDAQIGRPAE